MKKLLMLGLLVAGLALTGAAAADPRGGSVVYNASGCTTSPFAIVCVNAEVVTDTGDDDAVAAVPVGLPRAAAPPSPHAAVSASPSSRRERMPSLR
jgi:hypothetical protein